MPNLGTQSQVTKQDIEKGLRQLGLRSGAVVEVHSSLSSFGTVAGGANTVIQVLMNVVGNDGTLVMSAYPVSPAIPLTQEDVARGITWKVRLLDPDSNEKTGMGVIADAFRRRPDVACGSGFHRTCAWGRDAHLHTEGYRHLLDVDGWALLIGVDIQRCSSMHVAEGQVGIPDKVACLFQVPKDVQRHYPDDVWAIGYGSTPDDAWQKVWDEAERRGLIARQHIGASECKLFKASAVVTIYEEYLRTDPFGLFGIEED